jgi:PKD repeat protein
VAPCGVFFDATDTTAEGTVRPFEQLNFSWDFGDPASSYINRPEVDANSAIGAIASHTYARPGNYSVILSVSDSSGNVATTQTNVTVADPNNVFLPAMTFCVGGADIGCPVGAQMASLSQIQNVCSGRQGNSAPCRILFRRGGSFAANVVYESSPSSAAMYVGAYGTGAAPIITPLSDANFRINGASNVVITDLDFSGAYDPVTGVGTPNTPIFLYERDGRGDSNIVMYHNSFHNVGMAVQIYPPMNAVARTFGGERYYFTDNRVFDWGDYPSLAQGRKVVFQANSLLQNRNSCRDEQKVTLVNGRNCPDHGVLRFSAAEKLIVSANIMFNDFGWSYVGGLLGQPNLRMGTSGYMNYVLVSDNQMEGGGQVAVSQFNDPETGNSNFLGRIIWERNKIIAGPQTSGFIKLYYPGSTIRNNVFYKPNHSTSLTSDGWTSSAIDLKSGSTADIYNNTAIILQSSLIGGSPNLVTSESPASILSLVNNIAYAPSISNYGIVSGASQSGPNILFRPGATSGGFTIAADPRFANPLDLDSGFRPQITSPALGAGLPIPGLLRDYFWAARPTTGQVTIGAVEVP